MATYYIDPDNGSDAAAGTSFALAWKTVTSGATAARIAPGDTIRIKASPLPTSVGTATWTNNTTKCVLDTAVTKTVDMCETAWTAAADVTATTSTARKGGSNSASLAVAAGFTTGLIGYKALASAEDFSAYERVSLWIRSSVVAAAGVYQIKLCSDTAGAVAVDTFDVPALTVASIYHCYTIARTGGGALGNSIQSVALYAVSDPGTPTILLDCIIAAKGSASADSLSLTSLIGKKNGEGWFPIACIDGADVYFDVGANNTNSSVTKPYPGTTESVVTYKREGFSPTSPAAGVFDIFNTINDVGTAAGGYITFSGGWDRTDMSTQHTGDDGLSLFFGHNGYGVGVSLATKSFIHLDRVGVARFQRGIDGGVTACKITNTLSCGNDSYGYSNTGEGRGFMISSSRFICNGNNGNAHHNLTFSGGGGVACYAELYDVYSWSGMGSGITLGTLGVRLSGNNVRCQGNAVSGLMINSYCEVYISNYVSSLNTTRSITNTYGVVTLDNPLISETEEFFQESSLVSMPSRVLVTNHDQTADNHLQVYGVGRIASESTVRHTASGIAWKFSPTSTNCIEDFPLKTKIAALAVESGKTITVKAWMRRSNTGISGKLLIRAGQIAGPATEQSASISAAADVWEELTVSWTTDKVGVVEVEASAWGGAVYNLYIDDMTITQA